MSVGSSLQKTVDAIVSFEQHGATVTSVATREAKFTPGENFTVEFSIIEQVCDVDCLDDEITFSVNEAAIDDENGTLHLEVTAKTELTDAGLGVTRYSEQKPSDVADTENRDAEPAPSDGDEQPSDEDPEVLRDVYEACDSFREMRDALGSDVTPETIRRRMISHGIHTVPSEEAADSDADSSDAIDGETADDVGETPLTTENERLHQQPDDTQENMLPDGGIAADLTTEELVEVVQSSNTLYEARQRLEKDPDQTRQLLQELGLIDLVTGRLAMLDDRSVTREEIEHRIRTTIGQSDES